MQNINARLPQQRSIKRSLPIQVGQWFIGLLEMPLRYLFGRDLFISYSRSDARKYAPALALTLQKRMPKLSFYLDRWIAPPSGKLPLSLRLHLRWSSILVVVCTQRAVGSPFVQSEVARFATLGRKVLTIDVDGAFTEVRGQEPWVNVSGADPEGETTTAIIKGKPSEDVIERILKMVEFTTQDRRLRRAVWATFAFVVLSVGGIGAYGYRANQNATNAQARATEARKQEDAATKRAETAQQQEKIANDGKIVAEGLAATARTEREAAKKKTREAQRLEAHARADAERQFGIANANVTAAEAERQVNTQPERSTESAEAAAKSFKQLDSLNASTINADYTLRKVLRLLRRPVSEITSRNFGISDIDEMAISAEGKYVAFSESGLLQVWSVGPQPKRIWITEQKNVRRLGFDTLSRNLTTASHDEAIVWSHWDTEKPAQDRIIKYEPGAQIAISGDGTRLVAVEKVSLENKPRYQIRTWNLGKETEGPRIFQFPSEEISDVSLIRSMALSQRGDVLVLAILTDKQDEVVRVWDLKTNASLGNYLILERQHESKDSRILRFIHAVALDNDGKHLAVSITSLGGGYISIFDLLRRLNIAQWSLKDDTAESISFSPTEQFLATSSHKGVARIWDIGTQSEIARLPHAAHPERVAFSSDGRFLATGIQGKSPSSSVKIWDTKTESTDVPMEFNQEVGTLVALSPKGKYFAVIDTEKLRVWDVAARRLVATTTASVSEPQHLTFSPNEEYISTAGIDSYLQYIPTNTPIDIPFATADRITFSANGDFFAVYGSYNHFLQICKLKDGAEVARIPYPEDTILVELSPDSKYVAFADKKQLHFWIRKETKDEVRYEKVRSFPLGGAPISIVWSADGKYAASKDNTGTFQLFGVTNLKIENLSKGRTSDIAFSPNSKYLITTTHNELWLHLLSHPSRIIRISLGSRPLNIVFHPDGIHVAATLENNTTEVWDLSTLRLSAAIKHDRDVDKLVFTADGKYLVTASRNGGAMMWLWKPQDVLDEEARRIAIISKRED